MKRYAYLGAKNYFKFYVRGGFQKVRGNVYYESNLCMGLILLCPRIQWFFLIPFFYKCCKMPSYRHAKEDIKSVNHFHNHDLFCFFVLLPSHTCVFFLWGAVLLLKATPHQGLDFTCSLHEETKRPRVNNLLQPGDDTKNTQNSSIQGFANCPLI